MSGARKITVDGQEYRWRHGNRGFDERVSIWVEAHQSSVLMVRFDEPASPHPDYLEGFGYGVRISGHVECGVRSYKLHRPAVVASLIRVAHEAHAWSPLGGPSLTLDGFALLREHGSQIAHQRRGVPLEELATTLLERRAAADEQPPIAWLRAYTQEAWPWVSAENWMMALPLAGAIQFGIWLESRDELTPSQLAELTVWADGQQHRAQPGGLGLATWLLRGTLSFQQPALDDLEHWCRALLAQASQPLSA